MHLAALHTAIKTFSMPLTFDKLGIYTYFHEFASKIKCFIFWMKEKENVLFIKCLYSSISAISQLLQGRYYWQSWEAEREESVVEIVLFFIDVIWKHRWRRWCRDSKGLSSRVIIYLYHAKVLNWVSTDWKCFLNKNNSPPHITIQH